MSQIRRLCECVIWVDRGIIQQDGATLDVVSAYDATFASQLEVDGLGKQDSGRGVQFVKWNPCRALVDYLKYRISGKSLP